MVCSADCAARRADCEPLREGRGGATDDTRRWWLLILARAMEHDGVALVDLSAFAKRVSVNNSAKARVLRELPPLLVPHFTHFLSTTSLLN